VYALLFSDTGLTVGQISSLFVIWSAGSTLLEVPSGAWADAVSRRLLLCLGPLITAAGFALWVLVPSYPAFAVGFLLWGAGGALASGSLEALVYSELEVLGAAGRYARVMGRARSCETAAVLISTALAGPVLAVGGYHAVGAASVLACLLAAGVASRFPEHRTSPSPASSASSSVCSSVSEEPGWSASLRAGLEEARADRAVRSAVLLMAVVTAVWGALDEYTPLLAADTGVTRATVPLLLLLIWAGVTLGGLLTPLGERLSTRGYGVLLAASATLLAAGALLARPAGFVLVAAAFGGFQLATVLADARLQARITGDGRATVTSLAGMLTDLATISVYGAYALLATGAGNGIAFAVLSVPYLIIAAFLSYPRGLIPGKRPPEGES
jgi:MFS family permease